MKLSDLNNNDLDILKEGIKNLTDYTLEVEGSKYQVSLYDEDGSSHYTVLVDMGDVLNFVHRIGFGLGMETKATDVRMVLGC